MRSSKGGATASSSSAALLRATPYRCPKQAACAVPSRQVPELGLSFPGKGR